MDLGSIDGPARVGDGVWIGGGGDEVVVGAEVEDVALLTVDVLDGTQLEVVDEVPRTVGVVAETCTNTHTHTHTPV